jgi:FixJ family two-component response regulator
VSDALVIIVDDDASVRRSMVRLLGLAGHRTETYASAEEFLASPPRRTPACLVLDLRMPGIGGLELQERLAAAGHALPIVFVTGHGDVPASVQAMKGGAVDFLLKPFGADELLAAVDSALERARREVEETRGLDELRTRFATLTPRERQVFELVVTGLLNKQVAGRLGTSEKTVKAHRARVMERMAATSFAELVRMAERLGHGAAPTAGSANPAAADGSPGGTKGQ